MPLEPHLRHSAGTRLWGIRQRTFQRRGTQETSSIPSRCPQQRSSDFTTIFSLHRAHPEHEHRRQLRVLESVRVDGGDVGRGRVHARGQVFALVEVAQAAEVAAQDVGGRRTAAEFVEAELAGLTFAVDVERTGYGL